MALNGVPIYNDREGGNVPVDAGVLGSLIAGSPGPGNTITIVLEILWGMMMQKLIGILLERWFSHLCKKGYGW
jgi:hypothetical protein